MGRIGAGLGRVLVGVEPEMVLIEIESRRVLIEGELERARWRHVEAEPER